MKTPEILHSALRQFRHNNSDEFVTGFDYAETIRIVTKLQNDYKKLERSFHMKEHYQYIDEVPNQQPKQRSLHMKEHYQDLDKAPITLIMEGRQIESSFSRAIAKICYHCSHSDVFYEKSEMIWKCTKLGIVFGKDNSNTIALLAEMTCDFWESRRCVKGGIMNEKMV